jgi:hypothetical protein
MGWVAHLDWTRRLVIYTRIFWGTPLEKLDFGRLENKDNKMGIREISS